MMRRLSLLLPLVLVSCAEKLSIESDPPACMVFVDGDYIGVTPLETVLPREARLLKLTKFGYKPLHIRVLPGMSVLKARLEPLPRARVRVSSEPVEASVFIDGREVGRSPLEVSVVPGTHTLRLEKPDYGPYELPLSLRPGEEREVKARLELTVEKFSLEAIKKEPYRVMYYTDLAHTYAIHGRIDDAIDMLIKGFYACRDSRAHVNEIRRHYQEAERLYSGQFQYGDEETVKATQTKLIERLEQELANDALHPQFYATLAQFYPREKRIELYKKATQKVKSPLARKYFTWKLARTHYREAYDLYRKKKREECVAKLLSLIKQYPDAPASADAYGLLFSALRVLKRTNEIPSHVAEFSRRFPGSDSLPTHLLQTIQIYASLKDLSSAMRVADQLRKVYDPATDNYNIASSLASFYESNAPAKAIQYLESLVKQCNLQDTRAGFLYRLINLYSKQGKKEKAEKLKGILLKECRATYYTRYYDDKLAGRIEEGTKLLSRARKLTKSRDYDGAIEIYRTLKNKYGDTYLAIQAYTHTIQLYQHRLKSIEKAVEEVLRFVEKYPRMSASWQELYRVATHAERNETKLGIQLYSKLFNAPVPISYSRYAGYRLSYVLYRSDDLRKCVAFIRKAVEKYPDYDNNCYALYYMYWAYRQLDDTKNARSALDQLLKLYPHTSYAERALGYLLGVP